MVQQLRIETQKMLFGYDKRVCRKPCTVITDNYNGCIVVTTARTRHYLMTRCSSSVLCTWMDTIRQTVASPCTVSYPSVDVKVFL